MEEEGCEGIDGWGWAQKCSAQQNTALSERRGSTEGWGLGSCCAPPSSRQAALKAE